MRFAKRLPVVLIPKQFVIAFVRDDVIDDLSGYYSPFLLAVEAKRVEG